MIMPFFGRGLTAPPRAPATAQTVAGAPATTPPPVTTPPAIFLPADQYLHRGAPAEWWWHTGTLTSGDRVFGFEINTASYSGQGYAFSQLMLTDVANQKHYQRTTIYMPPVSVDFDNWAQHDVTKDWHVGLGSAVNCLSVIDVTNPGSGYTSAPTVEISGGGGTQAVAYAVLGDGTVAKADQVASIVLTNPGRGYTSAPTITISGGGGTGATAAAIHSYVTMDAAWGDPTQNMAIVAHLADVATGTEVDFDLMLSQQGPPFLVWGNGVSSILPSASGTHLQTNNYYYSLPKLAASGTVTIAGETFTVNGTTWMDHEYGFFGSAAKPVKWILQDAQLDNGWSLSNFSLTAPVLNQPMSSFTTLQDPAGAMHFAWIAFVTPTATWKSPASGITYFTEFKLEIPFYGAVLTVSSLVDGQEFSTGPGNGIYEGIATASGTFLGQPASGTAWNEQAL